MAVQELQMAERSRLVQECTRYLRRLEKRRRTRHSEGVGKRRDERPDREVESTARRQREVEG